MRLGPYNGRVWAHRPGYSEAIVSTVATPARSCTRGIVTRPAASTTALPDEPPDAVHDTELPARGRNCWQRRGVTSTVIVSLASSFDRRTDQRRSASSTSLHTKPRLTPPSRSPSL